MAWRQVIFAAFSALAGAIGVHAQPKPGALEGVVVNAATRAPVPRARIRVARGGSFSRSATADETGKFQIGNLEPGAYHVEYIQAPGYIYDARPERTYDIAEDRRLTGVMLELLPLGSISGKVMDEGGEPIYGAQVAVMQFPSVNGTQYHTIDGAVTDDRGEYRIFHLRPGRYFVNAWLPPGQMHYGVLKKDWIPANTRRDVPETGYVPVFYPDGPDVTQASPIQLAPGGEITGINFRLRSVPVFHIRGKLTGGKPDRETSVLAGGCHAAGGAAEYGAMLQPDGRFDIAGVSEGVYCLALSQAGFSRSLYVDQTVTVKDRNVDDVELRGVSAFVVPGTMRFEGLTGELPDVAAFLSPVSREDGNPNNAQLNDDGSFAIGGAVPGNYHVRVNRLPPSMYLKSVQYGDRFSADAVIALRPGGAPLTLTIGTDVGQVSGTVTAGRGDVAGVRVSVVPTGTLAGRIDLVQWAQTDANGHFEAGGLAPGEYQVFAWADPDVPIADVPAFGNEFASHAVNVTVGAKESATVQVKLIPAEEIAKVKARF